MAAGIEQGNYSVSEWKDISLLAVRVDGAIGRGQADAASNTSSIC
jgi:hypothetical protein